MMHAHRHRCPHWLLAAIIFAGAGCGAGSGDVSGTVTFQNKPVASGTVIIVGSDSLPYYSNIQEDGSYLVRKVPTGPAKIVVLSPGPDAGKDGPPIAVMAKPGFERKVRQHVFPGDPKKWFPIPDNYGEFNSSGLSMTIAGGMNQHDIPLD
jgi:hypothetical protein